MDGEHVGVGEGGGIDALARGDLAHGADAVAQGRGAFELGVLGGVLHLLGEGFLHAARLAFEKRFRLAHQFVVTVAVDAAHTRRRTALDLMQQARPRAPGEHRIRTRAQQERALQRVERGVHRARRGERAVINTFGVARAAVLQDLRIVVIGAQKDVGEALVVAEQNIVTRLQPLDQVRFEQQRLGLRRRLDEDHRARFRDHAQDAVRMARVLGVGRDALLQTRGLADIEHVALRVQHAIDAGPVGQRLHIRGDARGAFQRVVGGRVCIDLGHGVYI